MYQTLNRILFTASQDVAQYQGTGEQTLRVLTNRFLETIPEPYKGRLYCDGDELRNEHGKRIAKILITRRVHADGSRSVKGARLFVLSTYIIK